MEKILIVDDEPVLRKGLKFSLAQENYDIDMAENGEEALSKIKENKYNLIVLDLMLPKINGIDVCKEVRKDSDVPIIMLTAKGDDESKILGLEVGADDYIAKPFNVLELKARIKAVLRRVKSKGIIGDAIMELNSFKIDTFGRKVIFEDREITLTAKEFDLLLLLVLNENKVFSREYLLEEIWGYQYYGDVRTVDVHIRRLREKIETDSSNPVYIKTKWGTGYYFKQ